MTTLAAPPDTAGATGTGPTPLAPYRSGVSDGTRPDPRRRGRTTLAREVIEKIAGQAAAEIASASGRSGGFLGIGTNAAARPKVTAHLYGEFADLDLALGIAYPGSLRRTSQEVRERVGQTVERLTGVRVHRVDIEVTFLDLGDDDGPAGALR